MDGLSSGVAGIIAMILGILTIQQGQYFSALILLALAGGVLGFLCYNFHPSKIFMGCGKFIYRFHPGCHDHINLVYHAQKRVSITGGGSGIGLRSAVIRYLFRHIDSLA